MELFKKTKAKVAEMKVTNETKRQEKKQEKEAKKAEAAKRAKMDKEAIRILDREEAKKILEEAKKEYEEKQLEKEQKKREKADKRLEAKLELGTPITNKVAELVASGVVKKSDLYEDNGKKVKNFLSIIEEYDDHPQDDVPEDSVEDPTEKTVLPFGGNIVESSNENSDSQITPAFNIGYTMNENGDVEPITSSAEDSEKNVAPCSEIQEMIINDPNIREVYPSINKNDISISNGLILVKIPRESKENEPENEVFRLDIIGNQIYIQAPLKNPIPNLETGIQYQFVSVPICTDLGKEILKNHNYIVDGSVIDINNSILRDSENAA